jgi:protein CpxP
MKKIMLLCCLFIAFTAATFAQSTLPRTTDPVGKAKGLQKALNLNDNQTAKIAGIYKESAEKFDKIKVQEHGNTNKMVVAIGPLRTETIRKIKAVLTPKEAVKYDKLLQENKSSGNSGWSDGWSATN